MIRGKIVELHHKKIIAINSLSRVTRKNSDAACGGLYDPFEVQTKLPVPRDTSCLSEPSHAREEGSRF